MSTTKPDEHSPSALPLRWLDSSDQTTEMVHIATERTDFADIASDLTNIGPGEETEGALSLPRSSDTSSSGDDSSVDAPRFRNTLGTAEPKLWHVRGRHAPVSNKDPPFSPESTTFHHTSRQNSPGSKTALQALVAEVVESGHERDHVKEVIHDSGFQIITSDANSPSYSTVLTDGVVGLHGCIQTAYWNPVGGAGSS